jgi:hypothetical protein
MFIAYAFVGKLPSYIKEAIHQSRCFFDGDIYLIIDDINSIYLKDIEKYDVKIIDYNKVKSNIFLDVVNKNKHKFQVVHELGDRALLFIRSFERFFLLYHLMQQNNINDCLFLELDNLIYDDPKNWLEKFNQNDLCYMFDDYKRYSSGIMYVKKCEALVGFLNTIINFISESNEFMTEMTVLSYYYEKNKTTVEVLPTYWNDKSVPMETYLNYNKYGDSIFDALAIGCYLFGLDKLHTNNTIVKYRKAPWCAIDYTKNKFEWKLDDKGRNRPYIWDGTKWLLINNLHIHAKNLSEALSISM